MNNTKAKKNFSIKVDGNKTSAAKGENITVKELNSLLAKGISTKNKRKSLVSFLKNLNNTKDSVVSEMFFDNTIYKTWNYEKFKKIKGNRKIKDNKIVKLGSAIDEGVNLLPFCPVLVDKDFKICDGQHRFETAKNGGLPVYYMVIDEMALEDIATMNSNSHSWTISDYLNLYKELKKENYIYLDKFTKENNFPLTTCLELLSNFEKGILAKFKSGDFEIEESGKTFAKRVIEICNDFGQYNSIIVRKRNFVNAISKIVEKELRKEDYSHTKMMTKMQEVGSKLFVEQVSPEDYLRMFENIYNYRLRSGKIRLY